MTEQATTVYELAITADGFLTVHDGDEVPEGWQGEIEKSEDKPQENENEGEQ